MSIVETQYGKVEGKADGAINVWRGIPFAQPPLGTLRFRPPQPLEAWEGVSEATKFASAAAQSAGNMDRLLGTAKVPSSEDCLYLNIWSPAADNAHRPVLFWIHGGAFVSGSGSTPWYNGGSFAEQGDVVVVTVNYRLGIFGFLHLAELGGAEFATSGNCGILDQVAALEWVRDNIAAFGGDPNNVTIFGESAGSMSVATLMAVPQAKGLFHKAILQSGVAFNVRDGAAATKTAHKLLELLEFSGTVEELQAVPVEKLLEVAATATLRYPNGRLFQPTVDGKTLPQAPSKALAEGFAKAIPILIGTTAEEMRLFTAIDPSWNSLDEAGIKKRCAAMVGEEVFAKVEGSYADKTAATPLEKWTRLLTDRTFWSPSVQWAELQVRQNAPVWMYRFDWASPAFGGRLGACHALEIPFVWNNLDRPGVAAFTGDAPERQVVADYMHPAWIAFAKTGNPNRATLPEWAAYDLETRATMLFNNSCRVENDPQAEERRLWEGLF